MSFSTVSRIPLRTTCRFGDLWPRFSYSAASCTESFFAARWLSATGFSCIVRTRRAPDTGDRNDKSTAQAEDV